MRACVLGLGVLLLALVGGMELTPSFESSRQALRDDFGPEGGAKGRSVLLLQQLGMSASAGWVLRASDAPSSTAVPDTFLRPGQWLVSVAIPEESLNDPKRGILTNPLGRGREWERVGWVSVYEGHRLAFATRVGLRLQGGVGRDPGPRGREAFRGVFRPSYGLPHLPPGGPIAAAARPPDRFVIRRPQGMPQAQTIAFEIARRIGAIAPSAEPVRFVMNGSLRPQTYEISEHVSPEGWGRSFFGHEDFRFYKFRGATSPADVAAYRALRDWVTTAPAPLRLEQVAEKMDMDNFVRHIFTIMYCGTNDWAQGGAVLNLRSTQPRWFWVHWDLDLSFRRGPTPWRQPSVGLFTAPSRPNEQSDLRARLFRRLVREDRQFVRYFTDRVSQMLNHSLTDEYLQDLVRRNELRSVQPIPFNGFDLSTFFERRNDQVFNSVATVLRQPRPHVVDVQAPSDVRLDVDGHEYLSQYRGRYFDGQSVTVRALGRDGKPRGLWSVNGRAVVEDGLKVLVDRHTVIRLEG